MVGVVLNFSFTSVTVGMPFVITNTLHLGSAPIGYLETGFGYRNFDWQFVYGYDQW